MSQNKLLDHLDLARRDAQQVKTIVLRSDLPADLQKEVVELCDLFVGDCKYLAEMLAAREIAWGEISRLDSSPDASGNVAWGTGHIAYRQARFLAMQAYLSTKWAMMDRIARIVSQVFCIASAVHNPKNNIQFMQYFVTEERKKKTAVVLLRTNRGLYGWALGLSYAMRNHFVHDGAELNRVEFFDGSDVSSGFRVSNGGWANVLERASTYRVDADCVRTVWRGLVPDPNPDLRLLMKFCKEESDNAAGVLLVSAVGALKAHWAGILGQGVLGSAQRSP